MSLSSLLLAKKHWCQNKPILAICRGVQLVNVTFMAHLIRNGKVTGKAYLWDSHIPLRQLMAVLCQKLFGKESQLTQSPSVLKTWHSNFRVTAVDPYQND